jgi:hypothetical protein
MKESELRTLIEGEVRAILKATKKSKVTESLNEAKPMNEDGGYALAYDNFYRGLDSLLTVVSKKDKKVAKNIAKLQQQIELELANLQVR